MRILVTGGAGYVGSHTSRLLEQAGHDVWVFDSLVAGHRQAVTPGRLIQGQLGDQVQIESALKKHDIQAVLHFAAFALVGESVAHPDRYYRNNIVCTLNLLEAILESYSFSCMILAHIVF